MKVVVVYFSKYGNTKKIAEAITAELSQKTEVLALSMDTCSQNDLKAADLVIFGSPTHYQAAPKAVRNYLKMLPRSTLKGKSVASFDTSLRMWKPIMLLTAAHGIMSRLRKLGGKKLVKPETYIVRNTETPSEGEMDLLEEGEIAYSQSWAQTIWFSMVERGR